MGVAGGGGSTRRSTAEGLGYVDALDGWIKQAGSRLWIKVPWMGPVSGAPEKLLRSLAAAVERGVEVRVLLRPEASNTAALQSLSSWGVPHRTIRYLHEKEMLVDDRLITFSSNFTPTELTRNDNTAYEIPTPADIAAAEAAFHDHWLLDEGTAAAGEETWTAADQIVPGDLLPLLGRTRLNPLQSKALPLVFGSDTALVVTAPTGSGKTTVGEAAVLKAMRHQHRKAVYITPSRALTNELHGTFERWKAAGVRIAILSGDVDVDMAAVAQADLWVATTERFESAFRSSAMAKAIADVGCIVVDEIHFLGDQTRGPLLEALLTRVRLLSARTRLVGLSATVANAADLADWLGATLVQTSWRPVQLTLQVLGYEPHDRWADNEVAKDELSNGLIGDIRGSGGSVIVFCGSKGKAKRLAGVLAEVSDSGDDDQVAEAALAQGVGLHYSGLKSIKEAERRFRSREISVLVATSGLAQGVNLPARAVVVRDTTLGKTPLSTGDALQMAGRAGRVGLEAAGFAFLLVPAAEVTEWRSRLVEGHAVHSHIADGLADHVLAEVLLGRITSATTLREWFSGTFAAHEGGLSEPEANAVLDAAFNLLHVAGLVTVAQDGDTLTCTDLGALTSRFLIDVDSAAAILELLPGPDPSDADDADDAEHWLLTSVAQRARAFQQSYAPKSVLGDAADLLPEEILDHLQDDVTPGEMKALVAGHIALSDPARLQAPGRVAGLTTSELRTAADDLARHLAWVAALGSAIEPSWVSAVAGDLSARIRWRKAEPRRGAGRALRLLERRIPGDQQARLLPGRYSRLRRGSESIEDLAAESDHGPVVPLVHINVAGTMESGELVVHCTVRDPAALPLRLVIVARSGTDSSAAIIDRWDGAPVPLPLPAAVPVDGELVVETVAYGRNDWCWATTTVDISQLTPDPEGQVRQAVSALVPSVLTLPKAPRFFRKEAWTKRAITAVLASSDDLQPLARLMAGTGSEHARAWRLAEMLRTVVEASTAGTGFEAPTAALTRSSCGPSTWALTYATLAVGAGLRAGIVQQQSDDQLVAAVLVDDRWRLVPANEGVTPTNTLPVVPADLAGPLLVLDSAPPQPPPMPAAPAWAFLSEFLDTATQLPDRSRNSRPRHTAETQAGEPAANGHLSPKVIALEFTRPSDVTASRRGVLEETQPDLFNLHPRAYSSWSEDEDHNLTQLVALDASIEDIAALHGRQPGSIKSRLAKLGLG